MPAASPEIVRKPLRLREGAGRTVDQRLLVRFPWLAEIAGRLFGMLPPTSRLRQASLWRGVRLGLEAFNRRDHDAALAAANYASDFEYYPPPDAVEAGFFEPVYRGSAGYREFMSTWSDVFGADLRVEPVELIDLGDQIVLLAHSVARGRASGVPLSSEFAVIWTSDKGTVRRVDAHFDHRHVLETVGLGK
jgi:ketosteroid isomerase-like protein